MPWPSPPSSGSGEDYQADYAVVVGPDFPTTQNEKSALGVEIQAARENYPNKGITLIRAEDMARLIRLVPAKRVGLDRLQDLLKTCSLPEEAKAWIDRLADEKMERPRTLNCSPPLQGSSRKCRMRQYSTPVCRPGSGSRRS